jgi:hypothetical protein
LSGGRGVEAAGYSNAMILFWEEGNMGRSIRSSLKRPSPDGLEGYRHEYDGVRRRRGGESTGETLSGCSAKTGPEK